MLHLRAYKGQLSSVSWNKKFSGSASAGNIVYDLNPLSNSARSRHNNHQHELCQGRKKAKKATQAKQANKAASNAAAALPFRLVSRWLMVTAKVCVCLLAKGLRFEKQEKFPAISNSSWCVELGLAEGVKAGSFTPTLPFDASPPFPFFPIDMRSLSILCRLSQCCCCVHF